MYTSNFRQEVYLFFEIATMKKFPEIKNNTSVSWLTDSLLISETNGVLAICKVNHVHAVILFEYLKRSEQATNLELQRSVIKIDFGPAHKKYSITGKGKAQFKEFVGEEIISENIKQLVVGAFWFSETENILTTFKKIEDEINKGERVPSYSSSGSGSYRKETGFANCLTYAVGVLERYSSELKIGNHQKYLRLCHYLISGSGFGIVSKIKKTVAWMKKLVKTQLLDSAVLVVRYSIFRCIERCLELNT